MTEVTDKIHTAASISTPNCDIIARNDLYKRSASIIIPIEDVECLHDEDIPFEQGECQSWE